MIKEEIKQIDNSPKAIQKFGYTIAIFLLVVSGILYYYEKESSVLVAAIGLMFLLITVAAPTLLKPINIIWMSFAIFLGFVSTRILLGILFYGILTPIGLVIKLTRKDPLGLEIKRDKKSYWEKRSITKKDKIDYERQF
jgi:polyferredoxin